MKHNYQVIVGNIGTIYNGHSAKDARAIFADYKRASLAGQGRVAGEPVTLMRDDDPLREYIPLAPVTVTLKDGPHKRQYFEYRYSIDDVGGACFHTLAEVGAPWQAEARRQRNAIAKGRPVRTRDDLPAPVCVADCLEPASIVRTYRLWTYDVWGNARDGYDVNDRYKHGTVQIRCKRDVSNAGTLNEFSTYEPTDGQLSRAVGVTGAEWDWQDGDYYATRKRDGKPLGELILEAEEGGA